MTIEKVQISLRATNLTNVAGAFKGVSDPYAVVTLVPNDNRTHPKVLGKTEVVKNSLSPDWIKTFYVDYELGTPVSILVKIYDEVRKGDDIEMGSSLFEIGSVLGSKGNTKAKKMKRGGNLFVRAEKAIGTGSLRLKLSGISLKNTEGFMKKSDPFYQFVRKDYGQRGSEWNIVHKSATIKNSLDPNWDEETIGLPNLCGGDVDLPLSLQIYDYESSGKHVPMGMIETSVRELVKACKSASRLNIKTNGAATGTIVVHTAYVSGDEGNLEEKMTQLDLLESSSPPSPLSAIIPHPKKTSPTFLDYIHGGCEMQLCVAIDFTASNGDPRDRGTLHYQYPDGKWNDYEKAIASVGGILADFDSDKKSPVWGFGAKLNGELSHLFQCGAEAEVGNGVKGIFNAYRQTVRKVTLSGPTVFSEVIGTATAFAKSAQEEAAKHGKQKYTTLLILTDGAVSDVKETVQCIKACNDAPLSIVVVGIGPYNFSSMQFLDDLVEDEFDIVQFVEFNKHAHNLNSLTAATLSELPDQLVRYYQRNGIDPLPPVQVETNQIHIDPVEQDINLVAGVQI